MFLAIYSQILLYLSIALIMFLPGWFLFLAIFGRDEKQLSLFERFVFSFGLGLIVTDFIAFAFSKMHVLITATTSVLGSVIFCVVCYGIYKSFASRTGTTNAGHSNQLFSFSKNQFILILLLLFFTVFIKTAYLSGTVAPTATDMGHHTYWAKTFVESGQLPTYDGMPDFIIGEHVALGEMTMINHWSFFSAWPVIFLFLMNLLGILTVFLLTLRIFRNKNIAILTLLFLGVLFAVSSPQAKFVSGGVMGNIIGNFFMPMAFYFYFRAMEFTEGSLASLKEAKLPSASSKKFLSLAVFSTFGLFYTHHLTSFIFLFVFVLLIPFFLAINFTRTKGLLSKTFKIIFSAPVLATFFAGLIFFFFIFTPNYVKTSAVDTAVGAPSKSTRQGLTLTNLKNSVGEARLALGFLGLLVMTLFYKRKNFGYAIVSAWTIMLVIMSCFPQFLFINLPSNRIGNYTSYPLAILSAYGFLMLFSSHSSVFQLTTSTKNLSRLVPLKFLKSAFLLVAIFVLSSGLKDSADAFKESPDFTPTLETFDASSYLKKNTAESDTILKDHNYLSGDTWMKLILMRGYTYPLSRSYFKRYDDPTKPREMCTLQMISEPNSTKAQNCFSSTNTKYLIVNPQYDSSQFVKLKNFDEIYNAGDVAVYVRTTD